MTFVVNHDVDLYAFSMEINTRRNCPVMRVSEVIWDKWSLLILRNLILDGPHRFQDFLNALEGIGPTTLSSRLKALQKSGLISRRVLDVHPPRTLYQLTDLGTKAQPMMQAIREFGSVIPIDETVSSKKTK